MLSALFEIGFWAAAIVLAVVAPPYVQSEWPGTTTWDFLSSGPTVVASIACLRMAGALWDVRRLERLLNRE